MRLIVDEGPALACIKVPAGCLVRNMRPMYHGTATVISGSLQDTNAWPSKNWGDGITERGQDRKKNMVMKDLIKKILVVSVLSQSSPKGRARHLDCWDYKSEIKQIHFENLPSELLSAGLNMTRPIRVLWRKRGVIYLMKTRLILWGLPFPNIAEWLVPDGHLKYIPQICEIFHLAHQLIPLLIHV